MAVTITGLFRNPIRNVPYTSGTVEVAIGDAFGVGDIGYISNARSYKVTADGMNGSGGITLVVDDDAPSDVSFLFPDGVTTAVVSVNGANTSQALEDLLTEGGDAPTGSTILIQGMVNDPQTNAPRIGMRIEIALVEMFATEDGVYLPVAKSFRMTEYGINSDDVDSEGVTLYVPTGVASQWRFDFYASYADDAPLLWSSTAYFDDSMTEVEIADVLDGLYATWTAPMLAPSGVNVTVSGANNHQAQITWTNNDTTRTGTEIEGSSNGTDWDLLTTAAFADTSYTHTSPDADAVTLYYRVRAVKSGGMSGWASDTLSGLLLRLMAYWKLNEASGNRAGSIGSITLTDNNTVGSTTGIQGNAAQFVGANSESLSAASNATLATGDESFCFDFWIYSPSSHSVTGEEYIINKWADGSANEYIARHKNSRNVEWGVFVGGGFVSAMSANFAADTWHYVFVYHDATANEIGVQVNNGTAVTTATGGAKDAAGNSTFQIGQFVGGGYLTASLDEIGFWKGKVLSAAQRTARYNAGAGNTLP